MTTEHKAGKGFALLYEPALKWGWADRARH